MWPTLLGVFGLAATVGVGMVSAWRRTGRGAALHVAAPPPPPPPPPPPMLDVPLPQQTETALPILTPVSHVPEIYPINVFDFGGPRDAMRPRLTGIANMQDKYGAKAIVLGKWKKYYPKSAGAVVHYNQGSTAYLLALLHVALGNVEISNVKIGDRPIEEVEGIEWNTTTNPNPEPLGVDGLHYYTQDFARTILAEPLRFNQRVSQRVPQPTRGRGVTVEIEFPQGLHGSVEFAIEYRDPDWGDSWSSAGLHTLSDQTAHAVRHTITVTLGEAEILWDIRVRRMTPDNQNISTWVALTAAKEGPPAKQIKNVHGATVMQRWLEIRATASNQVNGVLGQVSCDVVNHFAWRYDIGLGEWVGVEQPEDRNNASCALVAILVSPESNSEFAFSDLDGPSFAELFDFCKTHKITFNHVYDTRTTILQAAQDVMALARCVLYDKGGKVAVAIDRRKTEVVQIFTPVNSWGYSGEIVLPDVPHYVRVQWTNPEADNAEDECYVYDDGYDATNALRHEKYFAVGCTNAELAWKFGRLKLAEAVLRQEEHHIYTQLDWLICNRGDLVLFSHDAIKAGGGSARIKDLVVSGPNIIAVILDNAVPMADGQTYGIRIRASDGRYITRAVVTDPGEQTVVQLVTPISTSADPQPAADDLVLFGELNREGVEMIVKAIEPLEDHTARLTLIPHAAELFSALTSNIPEPPPSVTDIHAPQKVVQPPVITNVRSDESVLVRQTNGSLQSRILLTVSPPSSDIAYFEPQYKRTDARSWTSLPSVKANQGEISIAPVVDEQIYDVRVRAISDTFIPSAWWQIQHKVIGKTSKPPNVMSLDPAGKLLTITADLPVDFAGFRIKWNNGANQNWQSAEVLAWLHATNQFDLSALPGGLQSIGVVIVDLNGNESAEPKWIIKDFAGPEMHNLWYTESQAPTFAGTIENGVVDAGVLKATEDDTTLWVDDDNALLWDADSSQLLWRSRYHQLRYTWNFIPPADLVEPFDVHLATDIEGESVVIEYRGDGKNPLWDVSPGGDDRPLWDTDSSTKLWDDDDPFVPWPGAIPGRQEKFQWRITCLASSRIQGLIRQADNLIDLPDKSEVIENFVVDDAAGKRVPLVNTYRRLVHVLPTLNYSADHPTANSFVVVDKLAVGPFIQVRDAAGSGTTGIIDVEVKGY